MDIQRLPKVELHCHLDGVISPAMARQIRQQDPNFPLDPALLQQAYPVDTYEQFVAWWQYIEPIAQNLAHLYPILAAYVAQLKQQNVVYAEIMIAGGNLPNDIGAAVEAMRAFRAWANSLEQGQIQIEFLMAFSRAKAVAYIETLVPRFLALHQAGLIVGVVLAGPEAGHPVKPLQTVFRQFHEAGLKIEIHAGEWVGPESVWDALEHGFPDRIGHGVTLFQDRALQDRVQTENIHLEMCPTSNVKTGSVRRLADHPIGLARDQGLNFSINTDDPGPFETSMLLEYQQLVDTFDFQPDDFATVFANSLAARFAGRPLTAGTAHFC